MHHYNATAITSIYCDTKARLQKLLQKGAVCPPPKKEGAEVRR